MSKSKRIVAPFINNFGQVIQPNDEVFAVKTCTGRVSVDLVKYIGYIEREAYDWTESKHVMQKFAQISTPATKNVYYKKGTTELFKWSQYVSGVPSHEQFDVARVPFTQISTLYYNRIIPKTASLNDLASSI
jgi:hypothetical protein